MTTETSAASAARFVWRIWENTDDFVEKKAAAIAEFVTIGALLVARGCSPLNPSFNLRPTRDGFCCHAGVHLSRPHNPAPGWKERAKITALTQFCSRSWTAQELRAYAEDPESSLVYRVSMWNLGFRPSVTTGWAKRKSDDPTPRFWPIDLPGLRIFSSGATNGRSYQLAAPNARHQAGTSWKLEAAGGLLEGALYFYLEVSPFASVRSETDSVMARQLNQRFHLDTRQNGFTITGYNLRLIHDNREPTECVDVTILPDDSDKPIMELWPSRFASGRDIELLLQSCLSRHNLVPAPTS